MLAAIAAGWAFGMLMVPVPSLIFLVASIRLAMNTAQEVMFSALVGGVLADIALGEAELVGKDESLAILAQGLPPILVQRMDRHGEKAELHSASLAA